MLSSWTVGGPTELMEDLRSKLRGVSADLGSWHKNTFGSVRKEIKSLSWNGCMVSQLGRDRHTSS